MVRGLIALFMMFPIFLFSGEFTASVSRNQVNLGESLVLNLTLKDSTPKGTPSIEALKKVFLVSSQQESSNRSVVNGRVSTIVNWKLGLHPQHEGDIEIPAISIKTSEGVLTTKPITIHVNKGKASENPETPDSNSVTLTTDVSAHSPFKSEPFVYTVRLASKYELTNLKIQKLDILDAIVEINQEPTIYEKIVDGISLQVLEFRYLITPLKAGPLKIPPFLIQGSIPVKRKTGRRSFFDDDFDPFSMIQGFDRMQPFSIATQEIILKVQPAVPGMIPWLPAKSMKLEETWNSSQSVQVGEPLMREIIIRGEGVSASQLPNLSDQQVHDNSFKVYADKPETSEELTVNGVKSYRKEIYTIIPQKSGTLTLPEITINWWNVNRNEKESTHIPARTLQVLPPPEETSSQSALPPAYDTHPPQEPPQTTTQSDPLLYVLLGALALFLFIAILWGLSLQNKITRLTERPAPQKRAEVKAPLLSPQPKKTKKDKNEKLPDLNPT